jgi:2,3-bisphosphoglycerate-independent phosphoglycerate mutase
MSNEIIDQLVQPNTTKIILLVMDGVGGCQARPGGPTELEAARAPNLDALAAASACGLLDPVYPGVTPGSGPAHLGLFGYDPLAFNIGRGVLSALGVNFPLRKGDVAARVNFATLDAEGRISDRRAGRLPTEENARLCAGLKAHIRLPAGVEWFMEPEKEYRAVLVLRAPGLDEGVADTDPQATGKPPLEPAPLRPEAEATARILSEFLRQAREVLRDEPRGNFMLLRGFAGHRHYPTLWDRFGLRSQSLAVYPMYKGLARLVGMDVRDGLRNFDEVIAALRESWDRFDYFFLHYKYTDSRGEDGDFDAKVAAIEDFDRYLPAILELNPDVVAVTGDHSTPALLRGHSWHPVPVAVRAANVRTDRVTAFDELSCAAGSLGRMPSVQLMGILLACALRLKKFGA